MYCCYATIVNVPSLDVRCDEGKAGRMREQIVMIQHEAAGAATIKGRFKRRSINDETNPNRMVGRTRALYQTSAKSDTLWCPAFEGASFSHGTWSRLIWTGMNLVLVPGFVVVADEAAREG